MPISNEKEDRNRMFVCSLDEAPVAQEGDFSSLTELAAGIAHEINNPINGIINYAQILVNRLSRQQDEAAVAARIISEGERVAGIVKSLLTFAGEGVRAKRMISLEELLSVCLDLTRAQLDEDGIRLVVNMEQGLPHVLVDGTQIRLIFLNLISNARHALNERYPSFHENKILSITGRRSEDDGGTCVRIEFHDRGTGIPVEALGKVLTPFFSTKSGGRGTGLGLSTSRRIIVHHHGTLHIDSMPGEYTRVVVVLPTTLRKAENHPGR